MPTYTGIFWTSVPLVMERLRISTFPKTLICNDHPRCEHFLPYEPLEYHQSWFICNICWFFHYFIHSYIHTLNSMDEFISIIRKTFWAGYLNFRWLNVSKNFVFNFITNTIYDTLSAVTLLVVPCKLKGYPKTGWTGSPNHHSIYGASYSRRVIRCVYL